MLDVTEPADLRAGWRIWICAGGCRHQEREGVAPGPAPREGPGPAEGRVEATLRALAAGDAAIERFTLPAAVPDETVPQRAARGRLCRCLTAALAARLEEISQGLARLPEAELAEAIAALYERPEYADGGAPEEATECLPASAGKMRVLTERRRLRLQMHHQADPGAARAAERCRALVLAQREAAAGLRAEASLRLAQRRLA